MNGLWNGFFVEGENLSGPFEFGKYLESFYSGNVYESDAAFVQAQHEQGFLVPGTILTTQGHPALQGDLIEDFACRSDDGQMATWDLNAGSYFMCAQNPNIIDWMIGQGKKAIDAEADMITLDEIEGNGLVGILQYVSTFTESNEPGFCSYCLEGFRTYLGNHFTSSELYSFFDVRHAHPVGGDLRGEWFNRGTDPDGGLPAPAKAPARIAYPPVGAVFAIDPDIPLERQRIIFAASGVDGAATWVLDGEVLSAGDHVRWNPAAGRHTVSLHDSTGYLLDTVVFLVRGQAE